MRIARFGKKRGLVDLIDNPLDSRRFRGLPLRRYGSTNYGDCRELMFIFCLKVGERIGVEKEVREEVNRFIKGYQDFWQPYIESSDSDSRRRLKKDQLLTYQKCLSPEFQETMRWPLLEGDRKIIEMIVGVQKKRLKEWVRKYQLRRDEVLSCPSDYL